MPKKSAKELLNELRQMSGIASSVLGVDEVDWFVQGDELTHEAEQVLVRAGARRYNEEGDAEQAAAKYTLKGRIETLTSRLGGLVDFVQDEKYSPAVIALEKIAADLKILHKDLKRRAGITKSKPKPEPKQAPPNINDRGLNPSTNAHPDHAQRKPEEPVISNPNSLREPAQPGVQPPGSMPKENVYLVNGEVITEALHGDPFGLGVGMMEEVRFLSGLPPKRRHNK